MGLLSGLIKTVDDCIDLAAGVAVGLVSGLYRCAECGEEFLLKKDAESHRCQ